MFACLLGDLISLLNEGLDMIALKLQSLAFLRRHFPKQAWHLTSEPQLLHL
jgi:hypothetical protein